MRGIKLEDIKLKTGDIITFEDGTKTIIQKDVDFPASFLKIIKVERATYETIYEEKEILTKKEKQYLEAVIEPFKDRFVNIQKVYHERDLDIALTYKCSYGVATVCLPIEENTFMNIEFNKRYTMQELGLFEKE